MAVLESLCVDLYRFLLLYVYLGCFKLPYFLLLTISQGLCLHIYVLGSIQFVCLTSRVPPSYSLV